MIVVAIVSLVFGILCGQNFHSQEIAASMDQIMSIALIVMILSCGIEIGYNKGLFSYLKKIGWKILFVPLGILIGSIGGGIIAGIILHQPLYESTAVACGMGFSSLTTVILEELSGPRLAAVAFFANFFREIASFLVVPLAAKYLNDYTAIAPCGATSMDTTMLVVTRATDAKNALVAAVNGAVLTLIVPVLVPLLYGIGQYLK